MSLICMYVVAIVVQSGTIEMVRPFQLATGVTMLLAMCSVHVNYSRAICGHLKTRGCDWQLMRGKSRASP